MGLKYRDMFVVLLIVCVGSAAADDNALLRRLEATEELVKSLSHRVDHLESQEKLHLNRIAELEARDSRQQQTIDELQQQLQGGEHQQQAEPLIGPLSNTSNNMTSSSKKSKHQKGSITKVHAQRTVRDEATQRIRQADFESPVAFLALLGTHFQHAGVKQMFVFENVVTNIGDHYNVGTGIFTAPVEGIYVFSTTLVSFYHVNAHASFYRNGNAINVMYVSGNEAGYDTTGATVTLHLQKGDIITVRNGDANVSYYGSNHSSFTGFLLRDYDSGTTVIGK